MDQGLLRIDCIDYIDNSAFVGPREQLPGKWFSAWAWAVSLLHPLCFREWEAAVQVDVDILTEQFGIGRKSGTSAEDMLREAPVDTRAVPRASGDRLAVLRGPRAGCRVGRLGTGGTSTMASSISTASQRQRQQCMRMQMTSSFSSLPQSSCRGKGGHSVSGDDVKRASHQWHTDPAEEAAAEGRASPRPGGIQIKTDQNYSNSPASL